MIISSKPNSLLCLIPRNDNKDGLAVAGCQVHVLCKVGKIKRTSQNSVEIQNKLFFSSKQTLTMKCDHLYNIISYFTLSVPYRTVPCRGSAVISQPMCAANENKLENISANELFKRWSNKSINVIQPSSQLSTAWLPIVIAQFLNNSTEFFAFIRG